MAEHAGPRDDVKDDSGYLPTHARPKYTDKEWNDYFNSTQTTTVIPRVDPKK